jgi:hypothetical protein
VGRAGSACCTARPGPAAARPKNRPRRRCLTTAGLGLGLAITVLRILGNEVTPATVVLMALLLISGIRFLPFAMLFGMEANRDLR